MPSSSSDTTRLKDASSSLVEMMSRNPPVAVEGQYKRTRSKLALPEFDPDLARSPLKNARDAIRKATSHKIHLSNSHNEEQSSATSIAEDRGEGVILNPSLTVPDLNVIKDNMTLHDETKNNTLGTGRGRLQPNKTPIAMQCKLGQGAVKRDRSPSVDDEFGHSIKRSTIFLPSSSKVATMGNSLISNPKRQKTHLGSQGTLDSFFTKPKVEILSTQRRTFSESASSLQGKITISSPVKDRETLPIPPTPTLKQLREMPELDLRSMTPSPRKLVLQAGHGQTREMDNSGGKLHELGPYLSSGTRPMDIDKGLDASLDSNKENISLPEADEVPTSQSLEQYVDAQGASQSQDMTPFPPSSSSSVISRPSTPIKRAISLNSLEDMLSHDQVSGSLEPHDSTNANDVNETSKQEADFISNTCNNSIMSIVVHEAGTQNEGTDILPSKIGISPCSSALDVPQTPRHQIMKPVSNNAHLFNLSSLSPLTPLPELQKGDGGDDYGYEDEEAEITALDRQRRDKEPLGKPIIRDEGGNNSIAKEVNSGLELKKEEIKPESNVVSNHEDRGSSSGTDVSQTSTGASGTINVSNSSHGVASSFPHSKQNGAKSEVKVNRKMLNSKGRTGTSSTPRRPMTRAALLRQKEIQRRIRTSPSKPRVSLAPVPATKKDKKEDRHDELDQQSGSDIDKTVNKTGIPLPKQHRSGPFTKGSNLRNDEKLGESSRSARKPFVLTVPSSLSPVKASSGTSLLRPRLESRPFTFSLYPPSIQDPAAKAQAQQTLSNLESALDKLRMPPPSKSTLTASTKSERVRPATSLGFTREMSEPLSEKSSLQKDGIHGPHSRAGSAQPFSRGLDSSPPSPAPDTFKGKGKADESDSSVSSLSEMKVKPLFSGIGIPKFGNRVGTASRSSNFGYGGLKRNIFGKPIPRMRASQKTTLDTVEGSPVKGAATFKVPSYEEDQIEADEGDASSSSLRSGTNKGSPRIVNANTSITSNDSFTHSSTEDGGTPISANSSTSEEGRSADGRELKKISKLNASRRASMAFSALSESLVTPSMTEAHMPTQTSPSFSGLTASQKSKQIATSVSSSRPIRAASLLGRTRSGSTDPEINGNKLVPASGTESESESGRSGRRSAMGRTKMPGSLDVLNHCIIFVDVRTEEGEDAGALFVDMLRGLGAKVLSRVGQTCTHIVYKNGLSSTLTRYRLLDEPRPIVVNIAWVVECVEKREWIDESKFRVDIEGANVAGTLKRRRSLLPKPAIGPMDTFLNGAPSAPVNSLPKAVVDSDLPNEESEKTGSSLKSSLNPLEQARRRSVMASRASNK